jgi:hypothetical protein
VLFYSDVSCFEVPIGFSDANQRLRRFTASTAQHQSVQRVVPLDSRKMTLMATI